MFLSTTLPYSIVFRFSDNYVFYISQILNEIFGFAKEKNVQSELSKVNTTKVDYCNKKTTKSNSEISGKENVKEAFISGDLD